MAKLRLIVKSKSKAEQNARELEKAANHLQKTAAYLQEIARFLDETSNANADNILSEPHEDPKSMRSASDLVTKKHLVSEPNVEDVEAALILSNMRTEKTYTSAEMEAATALTMMQMGLITGNWVAQQENFSKPEVQESISTESSATGRTLRQRPTRVTKPVS